MADTELEQLLTAMQRQWSRVPSQKAKPYVNAFSAAVRSGSKITARVVGNHGTYTVKVSGHFPPVGRPGGGCGPVV
jgi:hypothetical protein